MLKFLNSNRVKCMWVVAFFIGRKNFSKFEESENTVLTIFAFCKK